MLTYETSISIAAQPADIWRVLSDVAAWPDWLPTITQVRPLDAPSLRPGARFEVHQPKLRPATWTVTQLEATRFVWEARSPGLHMVGDHAVAQESPTTSRVVLRFSFAGPLGALLGRLYRGTTQSYIDSEAAALKQKLEARVAHEA